MPDEVRNLCRLADITAKSTLLQIVRQSDPQKMLALVERLAGQGAATRQDVRKETAKPKAGRPKQFVFAFRPPTKAFDLRLSFNKAKVEKDEIIDGARKHPQRAAREPVALAGFGLRATGFGLRAPAGPRDLQLRRPPVTRYRRMRREPRSKPVRARARSPSVALQPAAPERFAPSGLHNVSYATL